MLLIGATSIVGFAMTRCVSPQRMTAVCPAVGRGGRGNRGNRGGRGGRGGRGSIPPTWRAVDLESDAAIKQLLHETSPSTVIYAHAVCNVSKCEASPQWTHQVNVQNLQRVIDLIPQTTRLIYLSSDHVFGHDGVYDETSPPCPISVYGHSRVAAEQLVLTRNHNSLVVRAGLALGPSHQGKTGHLDWLRYRLGRQLPVSLIADEARTLVRADEVAMQLLGLSDSSQTGLVHLVSDTFMDRLSLGTHLCEAMNLPSEFKTETRSDQSYPHLGRIQLRTIHSNAQLQCPLQTQVEQS